MRVILRRRESLGGLGVATDESLEVDRITLGRGTDQDVQLADMRVTLAHAEIRLQPGGGYRIECHGDNPVWVNGSPVLQAALGVGDRIDCGRFRLAIAPLEPGADLVLEIREHATSREDQGRRRAQYRLGLAQAGLGGRRWAWGAAVLIVLALLAAPAALRYAGNTGASLDALWLAGPSSAAHGAFVEDCGTCHEAPFVRVRNGACLACHAGQPHHSDRPEVLALGGMGDARCGACHGEHAGRHGLIARAPSLCTDCHANPGRDFAVAQLRPVSSFAGDHPGFSPVAPQWRDGAVALATFAPGEKAVEQSNLRFPHDLHLAAEGLATPDGRKMLACADCHRAAGAGFTPIRMNAVCAQCHRLDLDPDHPARRLPHAQPQEIVATVRDHFSRLALTGGAPADDAPDVVRMRRRPGEKLTPEQSRAALAWADARAAVALTDVFERRLCASCHVVARQDGAEPAWDIAPVTLRGHFFTGARFDHSAHRTEACARCHDAEASTASSDVLLPPIETCRQCHGDPGQSGRVGSACVDCHGFHVAGSMAPAP